MANLNHVGEICYLCEKPIREGEEIRYYEGPFLMHEACINTILDPYQLRKNKQEDLNK